MKRRMGFMGAAGAALLLAACGQKGPLYMPEDATQVVTRPTQTPAETPAPANPPAQGGAPNTPQTTEPAEDANDKDKKQPGAPTPR